MDDYFDEEIPPGLPLTASELTRARFEEPRVLGTLPFGRDDQINRSLWVIYMGVWGIWTHAVLPVDNRLDMGDAENIAGLCELVAGLIGPSLCHEDEEALVVLRRPASPEPSPADEHIFRLIREAAASRETAPWSFFVTGPDGARELHAPEFGAELSAQAEGTCPARGRLAECSGWVSFLHCWLVLISARIRCSKNMIFLI